MQRNTENMAIVSIIAFSLLIVGCYAINYKPLTVTEYDGPKIVAVHEVTPAQIYNSGLASFQAAKRGNNVVTIERALYEGYITQSDYNYAKAFGYTIMEVDK
jgi:hypothetical protein